MLNEYDRSVAHPWEKDQSDLLGSIRKSPMWAGPGWYRYLPIQNINNDKMSY